MAQWVQGCLAWNVKLAGVVRSARPILHLWFESLRVESFTLSMYELEACGVEALVAPIMPSDVCLEPNTGMRIESKSGVASPQPQQHRRNA